MNSVEPLYIIYIYLPIPAGTPHVGQKSLRNPHEKHVVHVGKSTIFSIRNPLGTKPPPPEATIEASTPVPQSFDQAVTWACSAALRAAEVRDGMINALPSGELTFCYGKSPFFMGKSTISMAIFNCYVSSPEGNANSWIHDIYRENWHCGIVI